MDKVKCNLCGADDYKIVIKGKDRLHGIEGEFEYVKCNQCGLVYMNPQIGMEELAHFYPDDYAPTSQNRISRNNRKKRCVKKVFCRKMFCKI